MIKCQNEQYRGLWGFVGETQPSNSAPGLPDSTTVRKLMIVFALYFLQQAFSSTYYVPAMCFLGKASFLPSRLTVQQIETNASVGKFRKSSPLMFSGKSSGGGGPQAGLQRAEVSSANRRTGYSVKRRTWRESSWWSSQPSFWS